MHPSVIPFKSLRSDTWEEPAAKPPRTPGAGSGNTDFVTVALEPGGKVAVPDFVRKLLGVEEGGKLVLKVQPNGTVLMDSLQRVVDEARDQLMTERGRKGPGSKA